MAVKSRPDQGKVVKTEPSLEDRLMALRHRTSVEVGAARGRVISKSLPARKVPAGMTLEQVIVGSWRDEEPEKDIIAALDLIS